MVAALRVRVVPNKFPALEIEGDLNQRSEGIYDMIFKNVGAAAGASIEHTHSQLIATPIVPITVQEEIAGALELFARIVRRVTRKIETALDRPAYTYVVHTAPFDTKELGHYHWHIEIIPRLTKMAGFEWGSGFYINPVPPEEAAGFLRETDGEQLAAKDNPVRKAGKDK